MKNVFFWIFLVSLLGEVNAQISRRSPIQRERRENSSNAQDSLSSSKISATRVNDLKKSKAKIQDYLIISFENDTTYVDTTLSIQKEYKFNYLRKDNFGLIPFSNLGQTYNSLTYNFENTSLMPDFGFRARHFNFMEIEDISYYRVPTPLTELFYKTAFEQGQLADSFFTVNTSSQFNFSIAYKGLRSLGKYQHILTSTGNFRFTSNYRTKNNRYFVRGHVVTQDLLNQENGGLQDESVLNFIQGEEEFLDRSILEVNFEDAESILRGKRFFLDQSYNIFNKTDSLSKNKLSIGHLAVLEDKFFEYNQASASNVFGDAFRSSGIKDRTTLENLYNQLQLNYSNNILGDLQLNVSNNNYNYGYDKLVVLNGSTITNRLKGDVLSAGGKYHKICKGFDLSGEAGVNLSGDFEGNFLNAQASFKFNDDIKAVTSLNFSAKAPNYNFLLYQSDYINYNWQPSFSNIETQQLRFELNSNKIANISADYSVINDYVYFKIDETETLVKPFQNSEAINYLRVKLQKEVRLGKFALDNTILYQNVSGSEGVLNVPEFTTRNTLYYSTHLFKKAMFLQTGVVLNYFTQYNTNAYDPVLAEFYVQNKEKFGGFPRLDFFVNGRIRQTRIFLKAEHFNSSFTGNDYFSAPNNPYRDFTVRFGVVWNFFL